MNNKRPPGVRGHDVLPAQDTLSPRKRFSSVPVDLYKDTQNVDTQNVTRCWFYIKIRKTLIHAKR